MDYSILDGKISFVCVGNELSGDDGFGPLVYSMIHDLVHAIDASTFPEAFVSDLVEYKPDRVILLDAADFGGKPGEMKLIDPDSIESFHFSSHRAPLKLFIKSLSERNIPVILLCVQAKQTGLGEEISPEVREKAQEIAEYVKNRI
jgi:hydrogenase 3 maturation protease